MAPFNRRQVGYIQAIAGRQQHRTLISGHEDLRISSNELPSPRNNLTKGDAKPRTLKNIYGKYGDLDDYQEDVNTSFSTTSGVNKSLLLHTWNLDTSELSFDSRAAHNNARLESNDFTSLQNGLTGCGQLTDLNVFNAPVKGSHHLGTQGLYNPDGTTKTVVANASADGELVRNPEHISSIHRATPDGFLNSTNIKFRFTLPQTTSTAGVDNTAMGNDHYEFRWIVWRHKRPTLPVGSQAAIGPDDQGSAKTNLEAIRDGASFRNPGYDFFMGQTGRKRGFMGYTLNADLDKDTVQDAPNGEVYCGYRVNLDSPYDIVNTGTLVSDSTTGAIFPATEQAFSVDDVMTQRINKDDYVVMKDVRFFLGKEHGKSHFEDTLHWDWNDPIDTDQDNVLTSPTLNTKNYRWHFTLIGTSNAPSPVELNSSLRWTTKMESG